MAIFSDSVWTEAAALRQAIKDLPFNRELAAGTLHREKFQFYIVQDSIYLESYSRTLSLASAKAPTTAAMLEFANAAAVLAGAFFGNLEDGGTMWAS